MKRFGVLVLLCIGTTTAQADEMAMLPNGGTLFFGRTLIHQDNAEDPIEPNTNNDDLKRYLNLAHCFCAQPNSPSEQDPLFHEKTVDVEVKLQNSTTQVDRPLDFWVGRDCMTELDRDKRCTQLTDSTIAQITQISSNGGLATVPINIYSLINAVPTQTVPCDPENGPAEESLWAMADIDGNSSYEVAISRLYATDIKAPDLPALDSFKASGAEGAIQIDWTPPAGTSDVFAYQALCTKLDGTQARKPIDARYVTAHTLCGGTAPALSLQQVQLPPEDGAPDAGDVLAEPEAIALQDPMYVCGETTEATASGLRIDGLQNGTSYAVALLVIDHAGNARGVFFSTALTPKPAVDFWEDIHDRGSNVQGGFCLIADTYGDGGPLTGAMRAFRDDTLASTAFGRWLIRNYYDHVAGLGALVQGHLALRIAFGVLLLPFVAVALLWHAFTLPGLVMLVSLLAFGWRRRKRWLARLAPAAALLLAWTPRAHAQSPYWDTTTSTEETSGVDVTPLVKWHVGVRVGPYTPDIDKQAGGNPGPYAAMFTKPQSIVPMLDVDRVLWRGFGQLVVGGNIGFLGNSNHAYTIEGTTGDPNRKRSASDETSFRLIPIAATVGYRFTYLDDEYGIPLVPYVRGGLAYYVWWITQPSGSFAVVCQNGGMEPCAENKARGASLGVQGSIGLQIRAERIDANAARSMRDSGIQHAGFYGELSLAQVDGFGSDKKLSVGARTWFAGVDFEF
jgi:hypothetical protein